jgi:hypothetical protein
MLKACEAAATDEENPMRRSLQAVLAMSVLASPMAARGEPTTEADAKAVEAAVRAHGPEGWTTPGVLRVRPDGEGYSLTFDTARALAKGIAPWTVKDATPVAIGLTKQADGLWSFSSTGDVRIATELLAGTRTNAMSLAIGANSLKGVFDAASTLPRSINLGFADAVMSLRAGQDSMRIAAKDFSMDAAAAGPAGSRSDVDADFSMKDASATMGTFPNPEVKLSAETVDGTYRMGRVDLAGLSAILRFRQTLPPGKDAAGLSDADRKRLREIFKAHLPLVDEIGGTVVASGLSLSQGGNAFTLERLDYRSRWEGISDKAAFVIGAELVNAGMTPGIWPKELVPILPSAAKLNLRLSGFDTGALWKDTALVRSAQELALLPRDHTETLIFADGKVTADLSETSAKSSFYDITLSGRIQLSMDRTSLPVGTLRLTARGFDKTITYLQDNSRPVPVFGQAAFFALMIKGLGKTQPDGSLLWDVGFDESGKIMVNGQALPM